MANPQITVTPNPHRSRHYRCLPQENSFSAFPALCVAKLANEKVNHSVTSSSISATTPARALFGEFHG
jgi:hypothetical protein